MVWFLGAGSGGHLAPNYSIYKGLNHREGLSFRFVITNGELEKNYSSGRKLPTYYYLFDRLVTGNLFQKVFKVSVCIVQSLWFLWLDKPALIISTGGYASFPGLFWARFLSIPYVLIEPNKVAGKVNRWFSSGAEIIVTNYSGVFGADNTKVLRLGIPLLLSPKRKKGQTLLAFGASQGAQSINRLMEKVVEDGLIRPIHWIVGAKNFEKFCKYNEIEGVTVEAFCNDMQSAYEGARVVLCRSGAGTVAEVHAMRLPAIFVPFPDHMDKQQYKNCEYLQEAGCCLVWEDDSLSSKLLDLNKLWIEDSKFQEMCVAYQDLTLNPTDACDKVVSELLKFLSRG